MTAAMAGAPRAALRGLAQSYGVQLAFYDVSRHRRAARVDSLVAALRALGAPLERGEDAPDALRERLRATWRQGLETVTVAWQGSPAEVEVRLPAGAAAGSAEGWIEIENGERRQLDLDLERLALLRAASVDGTNYECRRLRVPGELPLGYHKLHIRTRKASFESLLIAAPARAVDGPMRTWGVFAPIYGLQSARSWGAGDFSDFEALEDWAAGLGGGVVSTLPFLAAFLDEPCDISPYAPASRLIWNDLYADPRRTAEFAQCREAREMASSAAFAKEVDALQSTPLVEYRRLLSLKRRVFETLARWLAGEKGSRYAEFRRYLDSQPVLQDYATFRAAGDRLRSAWPQWPVALRNGSIAPEDFDEDSRLYHLYAQWIAHEQVASLAGKARRSGPGLYLDLPLGVHAASYDVWRHREVFALEAEGGAPPDSVFTNGQNWAFPPLHPEAIRRQGYGYFIACLRHQLAQAGLLRIDHIMGLHRLYWIPKGLDATQGVYVRYRAEELYAILCLESQRHGALIVGENLGTVPAAVNTAMTRHGIKKMYVVQYETQPNPNQPLRTPPVGAVASLNTHDMPPFAAFLAGQDLETLVRLGLLSEAEASTARELRTRTRQYLAALFERSGHLPEGCDDAAALLRACLAWLAASSAAVVLVNLEDLWLETAPQNVPSTGADWPNWRNKARHRLEELRELPEVTGALGGLARLRPRMGGTRA